MNVPPDFCFRGFAKSDYAVGQSMRLAFLTHEPFYPPSGGGSAEAVYLVEEAVRRGHETHIFCPRVAEPRMVEDRFKVKLHQFQAWTMGRYARFRNFKYVLYPAFLARMVEAAARQDRFELLISQHSIAAVAAGKLRARLKVPVVMNFLDYLSGFMESWPPYVMPKPILQRIMNFELSLPGRYQADGVMTVSDTLADYFADEGYPRTRLLPIYYGYDPDLFGSAPPSGQTEAQGRPVVVMHGSFDQHHLGNIAYDAITSVLAKRPEVVFRFVGHHTPALKRLVARVRSHRANAPLECPGFLPYAEVARQLAGASVGMVPYEASRGVHCAFVAKIVEYVASGLPVASTPLDSAKRFFSNEPIVRFAEFNGASLGAKILGWLEEPLEQRRALAAPAMQRVKAQLDWRVISRKAVDFLETTHAKFL
jgi:glycosyltransferase involved in cell wall biosynthesis